MKLGWFALQVGACGCALALSASSLFAQRPSSERNLETDSVSRGPAAPLNREAGVLDVRKLKGTIGKVDLDQRTVTIVPNKKKQGELELSFSQPRGREQIKLSKKAAKILGKKGLELEEVRPGSKVRLQYYPGLGQLMELIIEKPAS